MYLGHPISYMFVGAILFQLAWSMKLLVILGLASWWYLTQPLVGVSYERLVKSMNRLVFQAQKGQIVLAFGPMFAGKTEWMLNLLKRFRIAGLRPMSIKHVIDRRYSSGAEIRTHDALLVEKKDCILSETLVDVYEDRRVQEADVILIYDGQFFHRLREAASYFRSLGKLVIVEAINGDDQRQPWPYVSELIPEADDILHFKSVCDECKDVAPFTSSDRSTNRVRGTVQPGGKDIYRPLCNTCWTENNTGANKKVVLQT